MINSSTYLVKSNDYQSNMFEGFDEMRKSFRFFDVGLMCKDSNNRILNGHKIILSSSSAVFKKILSQQPLNSTSKIIVYLHSINYNDLSRLLDFIYRGSVYVVGKDFDAFLKLANEFQVLGLVDSKNSDTPTSEDENIASADCTLDEQPLIDQCFNDNDAKTVSSELKARNNTNQLDTIVSNTNVESLSDKAISENNNTSHERKYKEDVYHSSSKATGIFEESAVFENSNVCNDNIALFEKNVKEEEQIIAENNKSRSKRSTSPEIFGYDDYLGDFISRNSVSSLTPVKRKSLRVRNRDINNKIDKKGCSDLLKDDMKENVNNWNELSCVESKSNDTKTVSTSKYPFHHASSIRKQVYRKGKSVRIAKRNQKDCKNETGMLKIEA